MRHARAPHILDLEVAHVLRRYVRTGVLDEDRAAEAMTDLAALDVQRYANDVLLARVWQLRHDATAYDAVYLALAEVLGAPLLTRAGALGKDPRGARARVELVEGSFPPPRSFHRMSPMTALVARNQPPLGCFAALTVATRRLRW